MEREDQLIKELIKEGFLKSAPEDFTENVMMAVAKTEEDKNSVFDLSGLTFSVLIFAAVGFSASVIYYFNPSFIHGILGFFIDSLKQVYFSFTNLFGSQLRWDFGFELNGMIVGVILTIAALLVFDNFLGRRKRYFNVFV